MDNKVVLSTKNDSSDYEVSRKRAQKIDYKKIQEILQRNIDKIPSRTYTQYTRDLLEQYAQSPLNNLDNIREVSRFLERVSTLYKNILYLFSTMPTYHYNITPLFDYTKDYDEQKTLKNYEKVLKIFHNFKLAKECHTIIANTMRDGMYVGFMYNSDKDGLFLMPLDVRYCRIYGKTPEGEWIVYFNAAFFDVGNNKDFVLGINGNGIGLWDQCFVDGYKNYKEYGRDLQWFRLTPESTFCMIAGTDDEFEVPLPYYFPLFKSLLRLLDTEDLVADKEELQNYKLIFNRIPMINNTDEVDDYAISLEIVNQFDQMVRSILPDLVGWITTPFEDTGTIDFEKSTSSTDTDELNKAMNNLLSNAGINKLIVSSGDSSNANGIRYSIANDFGKISVYLRRIESWFNYWIKHNLADGIHFQIFDQSQYNRTDFTQERKEAASLGASKMDYLCSLGDDPYVAYNKLKFEALVLNPLEYMPVLSSTYTQSADSENTGGRPQMDEDELSEEGQATRNSGKNEDKGN